MNASLGCKRHCPKCSAKFFDMNALQVRCPKCSYAFPLHLTSREKPLAPAKTLATPVKSKTKRSLATGQDEAKVINDLGALIELEELDDDAYPDVDHLEEVTDHHEAAELDINGDDADDEMFIDEISDGDTHIIDDIEEDSAQERSSY